MAITIIVEDGTGRTDANSYASAAECDAYHAAHLYASAWTGATADNKAAALAMATRAINAAIVWKGYRKGQEQALEWPRFMVPREGIAEGFIFAGAGQSTGTYWDETKIPAPLKAATCEMARALLIGDRTANADTQGIASLGLGNGAIAVTFNAADRAGVLPDEVLRLLAGIGRLRGKSMMRKVERA